MDDWSIVITNIHIYIYNYIFLLLLVICMMNLLEKPGGIMEFHQEK